MGRLPSTWTTKDAQRRYRSVEALIRDVDHYRNAQPLDARRDTWLYKAGKTLRRNRRAFTAVAIAGATIVGL